MILPFPPGAFPVGGFKRRRLLHGTVAGDESCARFVTRLARLDLLAIDDWMIAPLRDAEQRGLTEVIEDRAERVSALIAGQLPATDWHAAIGDSHGFERE